MASIDLNYPPNFTAFDTWDAPYPSFYEALAKGARPANHATGAWYTVSESSAGELLLDGCRITDVFNNTCSQVVAVPSMDNRRVQLYKNGVLQADLAAVEAFANAPTSTWELWKAYYESYGFTTGRTGTWTASGGVEVIPDDDPAGTGIPVTTSGLTAVLPYALGGAVLYFLLKG